VWKRLVVRLKSAASSRFASHNFADASFDALSTRQKLSLQPMERGRPEFEQWSRPVNVILYFQGTSKHTVGIFVLQTGFPDLLVLLRLVVA
jgi:hypothetical protein